MYRSSINVGWEFDNSQYLVAKGIKETLLDIGQGDIGHNACTNKFQEVLSGRKIHGQDKPQQSEILYGRK